MRLGNKIGLLIILIIPVWIFIRAQLIYKEGPNIVNIIEQYKVKNKIYPGTLQQAGVKSILSPIYFSNKKEDRFTLMYSIFAFARRYYNSENKVWKGMD
jgi:hypothetical protein